MAQFPGFSPLVNNNADVGMTDADEEGSSAENEHNSAISRTAERFGTTLRISRPKLSIPNPMRNFYAISAVVDPSFRAPPLAEDTLMTASSASSMESAAAPAALPMTPVYFPPAAPPVIPAAAVAPQPETSSSAFAAPPASSQVDKPRPKPAARNKVPLEKGYSQMVWLRMMQTEPDLAGLKGESPRRLLTMEDIKKHRNEGEAWTVLRGRVYNITPYLKFHPGGPDMLMKAAGKDGTALFNKYHAWVNAEFLMEKCLVGVLDVQGQGQK